MHVLEDVTVALAGAAQADYEGDIDDRVWRALSRAAELLGWSDRVRGPLAKVVPSGARVLIKPNLVNHENHAPCGMDALVTHVSIINAAFQAAKLARTAEIIVGDAPIQGCDFRQMLSATGLEEWSRRSQMQFSGFSGMRDFRRTVSTLRHGVRRRWDNILPEDQFTLFDLGHDSILEPISKRAGIFRVTCYDPIALVRTHGPGRHQYLVAQDVLRSDVVINLPKLKMHQKAGVTCALKNLVGINGNKDFLPHHRVGGTLKGGDCYPGRSHTKAMLEYVLDHRNAAKSLLGMAAWRTAVVGLRGVAKFVGDGVGVEGSWSGNDTVWRMCLDLNRILLYGRLDGTLADVPQRTVVHFVDAVIAGQGNGPLSPEPLPLGLVMLGQNAAAVDWVGALLLGYDPERVALTRNAFGRFKWPISEFSSADVHVIGDFGDGRANEIFADHIPVVPSSYPQGWIDAVRPLSQMPRQLAASQPK